MTSIIKISSFTPVNTGNLFADAPANFLTLSCSKRQVAVLIEPEAVLQNGSRACTLEPYKTTWMVDALKIAAYIFSAGILPLLAALWIYATRSEDQYHALEQLAPGAGNAPTVNPLPGTQPSIVTANPLAGLPLPPPAPSAPSGSDAKLNARIQELMGLGLDLGSLVAQMSSLEEKVDKSDEEKLSLEAIKKALELMQRPRPQAAGAAQAEQAALVASLAGNSLEDLQSLLQSLTDSGEDANLKAAIKIAIQQKSGAQQGAPLQAPAQPAIDPQAQQQMSEQTLESLVIACMQLPRAEGKTTIDPSYVAQETAQKQVIAAKLAEALLGEVIGLLEGQHIPASQLPGDASDMVKAELIKRLCAEGFVLEVLASLPVTAMLETTQSALEKMLAQELADEDQMDMPLEELIKCWEEIESNPEYSSRPHEIRANALLGAIDKRIAKSNVAVLMNLLEELEPACLAQTYSIELEAVVSPTSRIKDKIILLLGADPFQEDGPKRKAARVLLKQMREVGTAPAGNAASANNGEEVSVDLSNEAKAALIKRIRRNPFEGDAASRNATISLLTFELIQEFQDDGDSLSDLMDYWKDLSASNEAKAESIDELQSCSLYTLVNSLSDDDLFLGAPGQELSPNMYLLSVVLTAIDQRLEAMTLRELVSLVVIPIDLEVSFDPQGVVKTTPTSMLQNQIIKKNNGLNPFDIDPEKKKAAEAAIKALEKPSSANNNNSLPASGSAGDDPKLPPLGPESGNQKKVADAWKNKTIPGSGTPAPSATPVASKPVASKSSLAGDDPLLPPLGSASGSQKKAATPVVPPPKPKLLPKPPVTKKASPVAAPAPAVVDPVVASQSIATSELIKEELIRRLKIADSTLASADPTTAPKAYRILRFELIKEWLNSVPLASLHMMWQHLKEQNTINDNETAIKNPVKVADLESSSLFELIGSLPQSVRLQSAENVAVPPAAFLSTTILSEITHQLKGLSLTELVKLKWMDSEEEYVPNIKKEHTPKTYLMEAIIERNGGFNPFAPKRSSERKYARAVMAQALRNSALSPMAGPVVAPPVAGGNDPVLPPLAPQAPIQPPLPPKKSKGSDSKPAVASAAVDPAASQELATIEMIKNELCARVKASDKYGDLDETDPFKNEAARRSLINLITDQDLSSKTLDDMNTSWNKLQRRSLTENEALLQDKAVSCDKLKTTRLSSLVAFLPQSEQFMEMSPKSLIQSALLTKIRAQLKTMGPAELFALKSIARLDDTVRFPPAVKAPPTPETAVYVELIRKLEGNPFHSDEGKRAEGVKKLQAFLPQVGSAAHSANNNDGT